MGGSGPVLGFLKGICKGFYRVSIREGGSLS